MQAITNLVTAYFLVVFALLIIPLILSVFIPPLGGPLVQAVLWLFFVAPFRLLVRLAQGMADVGRRETDTRLKRQTITLRSEYVQPSSPNSPMVLAPPGWYDDPWQPHNLRCWDGQIWTEDTAPRA